MHMGIELQIAPESVQNSDESRLKSLAFIHFMEHVENGVSDSFEKQIE
jgi:hypothetical protein